MHVLLKFSLVVLPLGMAGCATTTASGSAQAQINCAGSHQAPTAACLNEKVQPTPTATRPDRATTTRSEEIVKRPPNQLGIVPAP
jgi:hypothetical protein